jgi:TolB-like protein/class 3 adenylate cyclase
MASTRRLAAILAADVAGYSRLMGADEEGTHERLKGHLRELVDPKIEEHRGRIVKNTGDGLLAEFPSVVDAVRCAVEIQRGMIDREPEVPEERRIRFRIGVNLGDVIVEEHDIFGDGVNVAARLEALAEPGGICASRVVRDQVRDKLDYTFEDLGEQQVKNITRPVRVFALRLEPIADPPAERGPAAVPISTPSSPPPLSIVVLPFANLGNDPEQEYFADGITEDVTTDLSRIAGMFVISRNTAFTYKGKHIDTRRVGRELRVRYVLAGSVQRLRNGVRISAQLIDAEADAHLWAERFDRDEADLFAVQDEITRQIAIALHLRLISAENVKLPGNLDALHYVLRGRAANFKPYSRETVKERVSMFENALALDPQSAEAQSRLAEVLVERVLNGLGDAAPNDLTRAQELIAQASVAWPWSAYPHYVKGRLLRAQHRLVDATSEFEAALAFDRNLVAAAWCLAWCRLYAGLLDEVTPLIQQVIRLSPRDPSIGARYFAIGVVHLLQSRTDEAIPWFEKARSSLPNLPFHHSYLAAAYALRGETDRAAAELTEARRLSNDDRFSSLARLQTLGYFGVPKTRALFEATYFAGLRKAGMPEE